jgi:hypothetical protein
MKRILLSVPISGHNEGMLRSVFPVAAVAALSLGAAADITHVLEEGRDGCSCFSDTTIFSESQHSGGGTNGVFSGTNAQQNTRRALLKVDLSSIPGDAVVTRVELEMTVDMSGGNFGEIPCSLHRVTREWREGGVRGGFNGGAGSPAQPGDPTWTHAAQPDIPWDSPGGDFVETPSATANAGRARTSVVWSGPGLVADVQAWLADPASNHGWIIISGREGEKQRVKRFHSSEASHSRPVLRVTVASDAVEPPPEPQPLLLRLLLCIQEFFAALRNGILQLLAPR